MDKNNTTPPGGAYELSDLLNELESLQDKYFQAKRKRQSDEFLQDLIAEMDSKLERILRLTQCAR